MNQGALPPRSLTYWFWQGFQWIK